MFLKKANPDEFMSSLEDNLNKIYHSDAIRDSKRGEAVVHHLKIAANLFKEIGMIKEAKQVSFVINKFAFAPEELTEHDVETSGIMSPADKVEMVSQKPISELESHLSHLDDMIQEEENTIKQSVGDDLDQIKQMSSKLNSLWKKRDTMKKAIFDKFGWTEEEYEQAKLEMGSPIS